MIGLKIAVGLLAAAALVQATDTGLIPPTCSIAEQVQTAEPEPVQAEELSIYAGEFTITAYCPCAICCGSWADGLTVSGVPAEPGIVAVDPNVIPLGSALIIDGTEYLAADTGGSIKGNRIDICMESHTAALDFGAQEKKVWVEPNG